MTKTIFRTMGILVMALAVLGSVNLAIWVVDREPPIEYEGAHALSAKVPQGGSIDVEFSVFRKRICPVVTRRWLTDAKNERHSIPQYTVGLRLLAGRETYRRSITIPLSAAPGPAQYDVTLSYVCNPLQRIMNMPIEVSSPPVKFEVVPGEAGPIYSDDG